jgi:hypothetical protein
MDKNKNKDGTYLKNLSSVHHASFGRLHELTNNYNQATLLDKLIFWWQISTYTLDDDNIWFTRSVDQIAEESRLSVRTVGRYLKAFTDAGYIEKVNRLHKKKHLYIRVTEKLLFLIGDKRGVTPGKAAKSNLAAIAPTAQTCAFSEHDGRTDSANLAVSIYKEKDCNTSNNNTVSPPCSVTSGDNSLENPKPAQMNAPTPSMTEEPSKYPVYAVEKQIGERLSEVAKNYIKGTMKNLVTQHQLVFSSPEQVFSEIVFSLLNVEQQFPGVDDMHHRMNLIAKLMREKKWRTPKGFYNHWDVGQTYQAKQTKQSQCMHAMKYPKGGGETLYPSSVDRAAEYNQKPRFSKQQQEYQGLHAMIATETRYLSTMETQFQRKPNPETGALIESIAMKLASLHQRVGELQIVLEEAA